MCACKETNVRESLNDRTFAGGERQGSRREMCYVTFNENPVSSLSESGVFNHSFPCKNHFTKQENKTWLTTGIKISCACKSKLYVLSRTTGNPELVKHYKKYCKILSETIKLAKKLHYNNLIINFKNKTKTTWDVIRSVTNSKSD
jgi:hypothetical protein